MAEGMNMSRRLMMTVRMPKNRMQAPTPLKMQLPRNRFQLSCHSVLYRFILRDEGGCAPGEKADGRHPRDGRWWRQPPSCSPLPPFQAFRGVPSAGPFPPSPRPKRTPFPHPQNPATMDTKPKAATMRETSKSSATSSFRRWSSCRVGVAAASHATPGEPSEGQPMCPPPIFLQPPAPHLEEQPSHAARSAHVSHTASHLDVDHVLVGVDGFGHHEQAPECSVHLDVVRFELVLRLLDVVGVDAVRNAPNAAVRPPRRAVPRVPAAAAPRRSLPRAPLAAVAVGPRFGAAPCFWSGSGVEFESGAGRA